MSYPDQISETPKVTPGGTPYKEVEVYPFGVQDKMLMLVPDSVNAVDPVVAVICFHGSGGDEQTVNATRMVPTRNSLLDSGRIVLSAFAHDRAWFNDDALDDYARVAQYANQQWNIYRFQFHGQSMGGGTAALLFSQNRVPNVRGIAMVDPALNLAAAYAHPSHRAHIRAAYGLAADGSDYSVKTAGHDPVLLDRDLFRNAQILIWASYDDTSTPRSQHADVFISRYQGYPRSMELIPVTGEHLIQSHYQPEPLLEFLDAVLEDEPEPIYEITDMFFVGQYGKLYRIQPEVLVD